VIIAGAGIGGLEALTTLQSLAGDRTQVTVLDPETHLELAARSVEPPFARAGSPRYSLQAICADHGARFNCDALKRVVDHPGTVITADGDELPYDSLVVAVGARREPAYDDALSFRGIDDAESMHGLVQDLEGGYLRRLAFVVPSGITWPLPIYELALLTAERAHSLCLDRVQVSLVTVEAAPLDVFGADLADAITRELVAARIRLVPSTAVAHVTGGTLFDAGANEILHAQRVVAAPLLRGRRIAGLPLDSDGFVPSDAYCRVDHMRGVYSIGDGSSQPIKQGGLAAQQGSVAAHHIAMRAGLDVDVPRFDGVLRAKVLSGDRAIFLRHGSHTGPDTASDHALWWPPAKVMAPHLAAYLERLDHGERGPAPEPPVQVVLAEGDPAGGIELLGG
jgi:sulfide:quinone oxidoreductase